MSTDEQPLECLKVIVRSPNDRFPTITVEFDRSWNVSDLKTHLSDQYPLHPPPSSQRLIYAGKLLKDGDALKDVFKPTSEIPTVHIVCSTVKSSNQAQEEPLQNVVGNSEREEQSAAFGDIPPEELQRYQWAYYQYLHQFYLNSLASVNAPGGQSIPICGGVSPSGPYHAWCMPTYTTLSGGPLVASSSFPTQSATAARSPEITPSTTQATSRQPGGLRHRFMQGARAFLSGAVADRRNGENAAAVAAQPDNLDAGMQQPDEQPPQQAAGGFMAGPVVDDAGDALGGGVDIIDRFYMLFRLTLFIGLCVAYSSLDKAIIVFSVIVYVYLYNIYRRYAAVDRAVQQLQQQLPQLQGRANNAAADAAEPQPVVTTEDSINTNDPNAMLDAPTNTLSGDQNRSASPTHASRLYRFSGSLRMVATVTFQFVSTLITSLIPEQPPPMRLD